MNLLHALHGRAIYERRVERLATHLSELIPPEVKVLDVGCGDGQIDRALVARRPDLAVEGMDVLIRPVAAIPVRKFDGSVIPLADASVDVVTFVDVLHHTPDPLVLLREAARVSRHLIVIKDHLAEGPLARAVLRFMDRVGNERHGVALPFTYWASARWSQAFAELGLRVESERRDLRLYPPGLDAVFGGGLHFLARLAVPGDPGKTHRTDRSQAQGV